MKIHELLGEDAAIDFTKALSDYEKKKELQAKADAAAQQAGTLRKAFYKGKRTGDTAAKSRLGQMARKVFTNR